MNILVLGAGLVGAPMAIDLAQAPRFNITVADVDQTALDRLSHWTQPQVDTLHADVARIGLQADTPDGPLLEVEIRPSS